MPGTFKWSSLSMRRHVATLELKYVKYFRGVTNIYLYFSVVSNSCITLKIMCYIIYYRVIIP